MKKFLSLVLALVMTMSLVTVSAGAKDFTDDSKIAYDEAVAVMSEVKVVDGYANGSFNPQATLTRGAAAKIICNLILGPTTAAALTANQAPYKDVPANHTFAGYIAFCKQQGIISGYADETFRPAATLTSYAFMKMLLGALGYDADVEHYVGANWSIQVAKRALQIGLDDGLKNNFVGTKPVTREEACLYAFNTLQADMVEYDTTIQIGNITVAGSKAEACAQGSYKNTMNKSGLQFAEKYFQDLKMTKGSDDFARPSTTWKVKTTKVGTYTDTPDATYVGKVELGTIYNDLGMSNKDSAEYFIDGAAQKNVDVKKGSEIEVGTGKGCQVEVFIDSDTNDVTICVINTWVGTVNKSVEATSSKDAYIVIDSAASKYPEDFKANFETDEKFEDDAVVLYTYSVSAGAIKSVEVAESHEGTLTKKVLGKGLTLDNTDYKYSAQYDFEAGLTESGLTTKSDYVVYLDNDGNVIYVEEVEFVSNDYAMILAIESENNKFDTNRAKVVFADGTVKNIDLAKDYAKKDKIAEGDIVTWKVDDAKVYTLKKTNAAGSENIKTDVFKLTKGEAKISVGSDYIYANSKTVFVVKNHSDDWTVYTGIKTVPSIDANSVTMPVSYFCKTNDMATIMFIDASDENVSITSSSKDVIFLAGESASKLTEDKDGNQYIEYNAVVNGEITTVKVQRGTNMDNGTSIATGISDGVMNYLYGAAEYTDGMISKLTKHDDGKSGSATKKLSGDYTISIDGVSYTVDEKAVIFKVDKKGNITESTLKNIKNDDNDAVLFVYDDGALTYIFVQEVPAGVDPDEEKPGKTEIRYVGVDLAQQKIILNKADEIKTGVAWTDEEKASFESAAKAALYSEGWMATGSVNYGTANTIKAVERGSAQSTAITFEIVWG